MSDSLQKSKELANVFGIGILFVVAWR